MQTPRGWQRLALWVVIALALGTVIFWQGRIYYERRPYQPLRVEDLPGPYRIIDVHEHIASPRDLPLLLRAMDRHTIARTVLVASSDQTLQGTAGFSGYEENNAAILDMVRSHPSRLTPFVTLDPQSPNKVDSLKQWMSRGAKGLKLYSGHGSFHTIPIDDASMEPVYLLCEELGIPIALHVNMAKYGKEFRHVLDRFPKLRVNCPHFCMSTIRHERLDELLSTYPSLYMDVSFGAPEIAKEGFDRVGSKANEIRRIILKHPDRFLFGVDLVLAPMAGQTLGFISRFFEAYRGMLEKQRFSPPQGSSVQGLALPPTILRRIYEENPRRFLGLSGALDGSP